MIFSVHSKVMHLCCLIVLIELLSGYSEVCSYRRFCEVYPHLSRVVPQADEQKDVILKLLLHLHDHLAKIAGNLKTSSVHDHTVHFKVQRCVSPSDLR